LISFISAQIEVVLLVSNLDFLLTKFAVLRLESTILIVIFVLVLRSCVVAVRACHRCVLLFLMLFALGLGHAHIAFLALVIGSRAPDIVHSEFWQFDVLLAKRASFGFDRTFTSFHFIINLKYMLLRNRI
jgi:hypothetical protein